MFGLNLDQDGLRRPLGGQARHFRGERGAEKHRLALCSRGGFAYNFAHVRNESHVQHPIGFVDNQNLHFVQMQLPLPTEIEQAPWSGNHQINMAIGKTLSLFHIIRTAEN